MEEVSAGCLIYVGLPDAAWVGAGAAYLSVLVALWGFWKQNKSYRESLALESAIRLDDRFTGVEFRKLRSLAAGINPNQQQIEEQLRDEIGSKPVKLV